MRQCVSAIVGLESGRWADSLSICLFSQSKLNKHLRGWSGEHLLGSAPLRRPAELFGVLAFMHMS